MYLHNCTCMYTSTFLHIRQMLDIVHILHRIHTALSLSLSFSFSHSICAYVYMKTIVKKNIWCTVHVHIHKHLRMQHIRTDIHMHIYMHGHHTEIIKSSRWRVMIETLEGRVQHLSEALSPPYWAKLDSWRRVDSGTWSLGWKKTYVIYCKKPCGSAAVASKLGILGIPRGSIEDVLQRLRAIFGGLQSAHVGMAGLPDGLRFGQGWARCPTSRLGVGEQLIDGLVGGLEHEFYDFSIYIGNFIIPTDELIFFRGVETPTTNQ